MKRLKHWLKRIIEILRKPEIGILPGHISFFLVLSSIPIITILVYGASFFAFDINDVLELFSSFIPNDLFKMLSFYLSNNNFTFGIGITLIIAFILASNGPYAMIVASNMLYKIENKNYLIDRLKAFIMTFFFVLLFVFTLVFLAFGHNILNLLFEYGIFSSSKDLIMLVYYIIKWPISMFIIFVIVKLLYTMAPDCTIPSRTVNKGAAFTTISWIITANIYSYYVTHIARYDIIYGNLSTLVILMMVIYLFSMLFVIGIAINTSSYEYEDKK